MRWDYFVILAGMRTGSNFLEANLNEYSGLRSLGELFNPHFIGNLGKTEAFGMTLAEREADPYKLLKTIRGAEDALQGFRLFGDHDPRIIQAVLNDPRAAKIILSRSAAETYVSLKIAGETGQWRLRDLKHVRTAQIAFDETEFLNHLEQARSFTDQIQTALQHSGQTGFFLRYEDVGDVAVMNGLARWLGVKEQRDSTSSATKKQNPEPWEQKVTNLPEMLDALARVDRFELGREPMFEPRRGAMVPTWLTAASAPLMYLPIRSGLEDEVARWLAAVDGDGPEALGSAMNRKSLRQWLKDHPTHRSFTVLRHPLRRLHSAFCRHILPGAPKPYGEIRETLMRSYKLKMDMATAADPAAHRAAFRDFARFILGNLAGQTSVRVDAAWASQLAVVQGFSSQVPPDLLLREEDLARDLPRLAAEVGAKTADWAPQSEPLPLPLEQVVDDETEHLVQQAYARDFQTFGFADWRSS